MMGYEGRSLLLDDGEEWVNIPLVVREFMRQLNDEVHASRSVMETVMQDQKEINALLRRVMQKQADLEMDNTRNTLSLNRAAHAAQDDRYKQHTEQIHYLRKRQERLDEKVQKLTTDKSSTSKAVAATPVGPSNAELADKVDLLSSKIDSCAKELCEHMKASQDARYTTENLMSSSIATATSEIEKTLKEQMSSLDGRLVAVEKVAEVHQDVLEAQKLESKKLRTLCGDLVDMAEKDRQVIKEQLATCLHKAENAEALCAAHRSGVKIDINRLESAMEANAERMRGDAKSSYAELRDLVKEDQHEVILRCNELAEELLSVKGQQKRFQDQLMNSEMDVAAARALKLTKELSVRIADLETGAEQYVSDYLPRREYQKLQREMQNALDTLKNSHEETKIAFHNQLQQMGQNVKTIRTEQADDNDWLHNELGRLGTVVSYGTQQREKQERQVASLCDIVHNLSVAVEALQSDLVKKTLSSSDLKATTTPATAGSNNTVPHGATAVASTAENTSADAGMSPSWEAWKSQTTKEIEAKLSVTSTLQQRCERLSHQLNELTAKVDGGARYAQSIASQHLDQIRQTVRDEVNQQLQTHSALRELTPALADVEAVKRRVAALELEVQSAAVRLEGLRTEVEGGLSDGGLGGGATSDLLRRLDFSESTIDSVKRRLFELSDQVMESEQRSNNVTRTLHQFETRVLDQEHAVAKLGTDLTSALESLLHTEESLTKHKEAFGSQMTEVHTLLDRWREEAATVAQTNTNTAAQIAASNTIARNVDDLRSELNKLSSTLEQRFAEVARDLALRARSTLLELDAVRQACSEDAARCTMTVTETMTREKGETEVVHKELRQHLADKDKEMCTLSERLSAVEAAVAAATRALSPHKTPLATPQPAEKTALPPPQELRTALARCTEELRACHCRLDAQQQRISTLAEEVLNTATAQDEAARREWQVKVDTVRDEVVALVTSYVAAQIKKYRGDLRALAEEAVHAASSSLARLSMDATKPPATAADNEETPVKAAELQKLVDDVRCHFESRLSEIRSTQRCELDGVVQHVEAARLSYAELRREVLDALAAQQENNEAVVRELRDALDDVKESNATASPAALPSSGQSVSAEKPDLLPASLSETAEEERIRALKDDVLQLVHENFYSKSLLEERLENIWSSMVSLLARKEDMTAVNEKLNGLHQLVHEELQIEMEKLEDQLAGQLAEKVSLRTLQDILEEHFMDPLTATS